MQIKVADGIDSSPCVVCWSPVTDTSTHHCCHTQVPRPAYFTLIGTLWLPGKQCWCWDRLSSVLLTLITSNISHRARFHQLVFIWLARNRNLLNLHFPLQCSSHVHTWSGPCWTSNFVRKLIFPLNMSRYSAPWCWEPPDIAGDEVVVLVILSKSNCR